ncbi:hypothetical protein B566_EDAN017108 [Ephemera danica]|nr:hypothetical protein B566_EDAN017108 [Ephemera danica]
MQKNIFTLTPRKSFNPKLPNPPNIPEKRFCQLLPKLFPPNPPPNPVPVPVPPSPILANWPKPPVKVDSKFCHAFPRFPKFDNVPPLFPPNPAMLLPPCIDLFLLCDGERDCKDGSDEAKCGSHRSCTVQQFRCNDGTCIKGENVFARLGSSDATMAIVSQEAGAVCNLNQFACKTGVKCIPLYWRCDGNNDCLDKSDEINCNKQRDRCPLYEFQCDNGMCLERFASKCDGNNDCGDASDEMDCPKPAGGCDECEFLCENSAQCIHVSYRCDGLLHCADASDEWECANFVVPINCSSTSSSTTETKVTSSTLKLTTAEVTYPTNLEREDKKNQNTFKITTAEATYETDLQTEATKFYSEQNSIVVSTPSIIDKTVFSKGSVETSSEDPRYIVLAASILTVILLVGCIVISCKCFDCKCPTQQYEIDESMELGEYDKENKIDDEAVYEEILEDPEQRYDHLRYDSSDEADIKNLQSTIRNKPVRGNNFMRIP